MCSGSVWMPARTTNECLCNLHRLHCCSSPSALNSCWFNASGVCCQELSVDDYHDFVFCYSAQASIHHSKVRPDGHRWPLFHAVAACGSYITENGRMGQQAAGNRFHHPRYMQIFNSRRHIRGPKYKINNINKSDFSIAPRLWSYPRLNSVASCSARRAALWIRQH